MFGFSFGELVVLVVVAIVVIGPKDLPKVLRTLGQWSGKLRRMASDLRAQSGIDDVLRTEGLTEDLNEIRKLARGELDTISRSASLSHDASPPLSAYEDSAVAVDRDRELPRDGPDTGNAMPDTAFVYAEGFPRSKWARDPVWVLGDPAGVLPELPPEPHELAHLPEPTNGTADAPADASATDAPASDAPKPADAAPTEHAPTRPAEPA